MTWGRLWPWLMLAAAVTGLLATWSYAWSHSDGLFVSTAAGTAGGVITGLIYLRWGRS